MAVTGRIHKGIGGFYYVETADGLYECKARGGECSISFREGRLLTVLSNDLQLRA